MDLHPNSSCQMIRENISISQNLSNCAFPYKIFEQVKNAIYLKDSTQSLRHTILVNKCLQLLIFVIH